MKLALFTLIFQNRPLEEAIRLTKDIGYDGVELMCKAPHLTDETPLSEIEKYKKLLDDLQLPVVNLATYTGRYSILSDQECSEQLDKLKYYLRVAEILNCPMVRHLPGGPSNLDAQEYHIQKSVYWFKQAADIAKEANKKLVMEIHNNSIIETVESSRRLVDLINKPNVGLIHDAGNMYITDTDYKEQSVEVLFDKLFHVHVKEEIRVSDDKLPFSFHNKTKHGDEIFQYRRLGEGGADHRPAFRKLKQMGYKGYLSSECHAMDNDIDTAKHELKVMREYLKEV